MACPVTFYLHNVDQNRQASKEYRFHFEKTYFKSKKPDPVSLVCVFVSVYDVRNDALAFHLFQLSKQSLILLQKIDVRI